MSDIIARQKLKAVAGFIDDTWFIYKSHTQESTYFLALLGKQFGEYGYIMCVHPAQWQAWVCTRTGMDCMYSGPSFHESIRVLWNTRNTIYQGVVNHENNE